MATTTANKSDQLVDILKQIQARKTVKPEEATKALQQYYKVQEHIKALTAEIELFKASKNVSNQAQSNKTKTDKTPTNRSNSSTKTLTPRRESTVKTNSQTTEPSPLSKRTNRVLNGPVQHSNGLKKSKSLDVKKTSIPSNGNESKISTAKTNGLATTINKEPKLLTKVTEDKEKSADKRKENNIIAPVNGEQLSKSQEKNGESKESERDKELAKLRIQNAQIKVAMDRRESDALSLRMPPFVEQKYVPKPEKLVEDFRKIYEQEWRVAFHEMEKHQRLKEDDVTELLAAIAREAYTFTQVTAQQQFEDITKSHAHVIDVLIQPRYASQVRDVVTSKSKAIMDKDAYQVTRKYLKDYRKAMARVPIPGLIDIFESVVQRDVLARHSSFKAIPKPLRPYMNRLVEVDWFMALSDPQIFQNWPRGGQLMSRDMFLPYSKKGATIIHTVWPALLLTKEGPVVDKGICLVK